jgi:hypothetical protein
MQKEYSNRRLSNGNEHAPHRQKPLSKRVLSRDPELIPGDVNCWLLNHKGSCKEIICVENLVQRGLWEWMHNRNKYGSRQLQRELFCRTFKGAREEDVAWILIQLERLESAKTSQSEFHPQVALCRLKSAFPDETEVEKRYVQHFQMQTAFGFSGVFPTSLWDRIILQASHHEQFVRHAITAIIALRKSRETASSPLQSPSR